MTLKLVNSLGMTPSFSDNIFYNRANIQGYVPYKNHVSVFLFISFVQ